MDQATGIDGEAFGGDAGDGHRCARGRGDGGEQADGQREGAGSHAGTSMSRRGGGPPSHGHPAGVNVQTATSVRYPPAPPPPPPPRPRKPPNPPPPPKGPPPAPDAVARTEVAATVAPCLAPMTTTVSPGWIAAALVDAVRLTCACGSTWTRTVVPDWLRT